MDHSWECQQLGHALLCTADFDPILRNVSLHSAAGLPATGLKAQPIVVQNALRPLYSVQNSGQSLNFFNVRQTSARTNQAKGKAVQEWLRADLASQSARGCPRLEDILERRLLATPPRTSTRRGSGAGVVVEDAWISEAEAQRVTSSVMREMLDSADRIVELVQSGGAGAESCGGAQRSLRCWVGAPQAADRRAEALGETIKAMAARLGHDDS